MRRYQTMHLLHPPLPRPVVALWHPATCPGVVQAQAALTLRRLSSRICSSSSCLRWRSSCSRRFLSIRASFSFCSCCVTCRQGRLLIPKALAAHLYRLPAPSKPC